jgi:predicted phage tail component-like protein
MFTFNGIDFTNLVQVQDITRPLLAPQKLTTVSIEGRAGSIFFDKVADSYEIEISFSVKANSVAELRTAVRDLADKLDTDEPQQLIINDEIDKYTYAVLSGDSEFSTLYTLGQGKIKFYVTDPFWYAVSDDIFTYTDTNSHTFSRQGNAVSYPTIEITGTSTTGTYTFTNSGSNTNTSMKYTGALASGEKLIIDSENLTAYILKTNGTQVSVLNKLDNLDFPVLSKGNNTVRVLTGGGATLTNYKVTCNSRWK